jgi:putative tryptophan/tyrosine transport system substrate-binding protein
VILLCLLEAPMPHRTIGLLMTLALATLWVPAVSPAQRLAKVPRIGRLLGNDPEAAAPSLEAFRPRLRELDYVEGQTIALEYRFAEGKIEPLPALAAPVRRIRTDEAPHRELSQEAGHHPALRAAGSSPG